jgi:outer membrane receptor protein involved in Fe transport
MLKSSKRAYARSVSACALVCSAILFVSSPVWAQSTAYKLDIPAENTAQALNDLSTQSGIQILFPIDLASKASAPAVKGTYSLGDALTQLLAGSGLEVESVTDKTITLRAIGRSGVQTGGEAPTEVIVTGSRIRGANPTSPVHTVTRKDIEASGYSHVGDLIRSLPENFSGGQNPGVVGATSGNISNYNVSNASTANLRGLGSDATLVLVNGHRLAPDSYFQGVDLSGVPLGAVQRVEVVSDGASALYGSDAVAGVVNFIMRRNYSGGEFTARVGTSTQGGGDEHTYSVLEGATHGSWYILGNIEYAKQDAIRWGDRDEVANDTPQNTLGWPQERHSLYLSAGGDLSDKLSLTVDTLLSDRTSTLVWQNDNTWPTYTTQSYTPAASATATLSYKLPHDWKLRVTGSEAISRNVFKEREDDSAPYSAGRDKNAVQYVELGADGALFSLPSGTVKGAFGLGYRTDEYTTRSIDATRQVRYAYGEILAPLVAASPDRTGLHELVLSLAGRTESYSDMGSSANPKIGLRYVPFTDLTLRASWGTSFKAPSFDQMYSRSIIYLLNAADIGGSSGAVLMTYGANPDLKPEKSTSWAIGGDYSPSAIDGLTLSANLFDIDYKDRILQPVTNVAAGLSDPIYAPFVEASPSSDRQAALIAEASSFYNFSSGAYDPSTVVAVLHNANANATAQTVKGIDIAYRQSFHLGAGSLNAFANATWLRLEQQTIETIPSVVLSGTIFNAPKFKARGGLTWQAGGLSASGIVNYIAGEIDTGVTPHVDVDSWTTVDATVTYALQSTGGLAQGVKLSVAASNLFDQAPPYTATPTSGTSPHFDSTNASIVGRFVSLTVSKAW